MSSRPFGLGTPLELKVVNFRIDHSSSHVVARQRASKMQVVSKEQAFTLIEILVVLSILGVLSLMGMSRMFELQSSFRRHEARQMFLSDIKRARAAALSQGARVHILPTTANEYEIGVEYRPYEATPSADSILFRRDLGSSVEMVLSDTISFDSRGYLIDEDGEMTSVTFSLTDQGAEFEAGTIFALGGVG
jgi:prepilin-type N-terminal cleavage/methylation domain-containing protein